ncbi:hypothetical protein CUMW_247630 [Citrus unshiu]|uniref:Uncharacterized protein n=1 Tax=Citrus unshiu TaxID=55188 RepID=A0A2H5QNV1_CITUN|nr:hypothetical protein CUMW_247630 [Citrus unshiu]
MVCKLHLPQGLQYLSDELRYLHWHGYPLKMLPSNFTPENLIELNLLYSRIEQLWKGKKRFDIAPIIFRRFIGFAYCAVIGSEEVNDGAGYHFGVKCSYDFETRTSRETKSDDRICYLSAATDNMDELIELDHILLGFVPCLDVSLPNGDHQTAASFKFSLYNASTNNPIGHKVKCCGVCPLYTNPNKTQSHIYTENAVTLNAEFYNDYEYHDKASTSESGRLPAFSLEIHELSELASGGKRFNFTGLGSRLKQEHSVHRQNFHALL